MRRIALDALEPTPSLVRPLYHECGALIFAAGERVADEEIALLRKNGIKRLYDLGAAGDDAALAGEATPPPLPVEPTELPDEVRRFRRERKASAALRLLERAAARVPAERLILDPRGELRDAGIERAIERSRAGETPEGQPWRERLDAIRPDPPRPPREKEDALALRRRTVERLAEAFAALRAGGLAPFGPLGEAARDVFLAVARDPDLALALLADAPRESAPLDRGLAEHSFDVAVLSIATAIELGYGVDQLFEIAHAALLHDLGMLRLPEALATKRAPLDAEERRELERHPVHAVEVLRRFPEVPVAVAAVVYEEHERPDGSGYPRGSAAEPGEFARIVAIADTYQALASPRPYRPGRTPHEALRELVGLASKRKLDAKPLRALMKALSLFPVGSWVRLSDGAIARVVRAGGADLARPLVALFPLDGAGAAGSGAGATLDLAARPDLRIAETLSVAPELRGGARPEPLAGF